jgi:hypothetical protein
MAPARLPATPAPSSPSSASYAAAPRRPSLGPPARQTRQSASCTPRSSPHLAPPDRARFEHQVAALSAGRPVYRISTETRAEPRLHLATCVNGTVADQQALARYQSHGAWLEWTAQSPHPRGSAG